MGGYPGTKGLAFKEALLWERASKGRVGISIPTQDVPESKLDASLTGPAPKLPELSEVDIIRHYTRLSTWNFGVDTGMYPLGSCTMKYNPKINERMASLPGFANVHPLMPEACFQGALKLMYELEQDLLKLTRMKARVAPALGGRSGRADGNADDPRLPRAQGQAAQKGDHAQHGARHEPGVRGDLRLHARPG